MTSMPASRRARAMTLAPRSWPSRPGLAMSTRIFFSGIPQRPLEASSSVIENPAASSYGGFFVGAEDGSHGVADLTKRGVCLHRLVDVRHQVFMAELPVGRSRGVSRLCVCARRLPKGQQRAVDGGLRAVCTKFSEAIRLAMSNGLINLQNLERLLGGDKIVYSDHDFLFFVERLLVAIGSFGDFTLWIASLDGGDHPAHRVNLVNVVPSSGFYLVGKGFHEVGAAQRIDGISNAGFVSDDLLRAQSDRSGKLGRQRPRLVERIGMQRLRAAQNGRQRLQRRAHHIVERLLCRQRAPGGLGVETQRPSARIFCRVTL